MNRYSFESSGYGDRPQLAFPSLTPAVKVLMIALAAVQVAQFVTAGALTDWFGIGFPSFERWSVLGIANLLTYQFVHAFSSLGHLLGNLLVLYFFGTMVERDIGTRRFTRLYLLAGVAGGVFWLAFVSIMGMHSVMCVGASGACYGVMTYAALRNPNAQVIVIIIMARLWWVVALLGVMALYNLALLFRGGPPSGVADAAHVGGMVFALAWWRYERMFDGVGAKLAAKAAEREREHRIERERELDRLLGKIKEVGMGGLSGRERKFLTKYGRDKGK